MKTGLTLGKFAPLHRGHQALIEQGIQETDRFIVLVYDAPEVTAVPLEVRAHWIRKLYPAVEVIEGRSGPSETGDTPEIRKLQEDYILAVLGDRKVTHFYSSEFYGDHVSRALGAEDRRVDPERARVPVSGTLIRQDPFAHRRFLDPVVYRDLVTWVVFLGAPSTGKTTLCEAAAREFQTLWMPEYGRDYWDLHQVDRRLSPGQLLDIALGHRQREDAMVTDSNRYFFIDTDARTTRQFSHYYHSRSLPELDRLADEARDRYDVVFLCEDDIPYDDTWDRSGDVNRHAFQSSIRADLEARGISFVTLEGDLDERMTRVRTVLERYLKWA